MSWLPEMREQAVQGLREFYAAVGPELHYENAFQLLIAVVLSAQTTDKQVNRVTELLFQRLHTPEDLAAMDVEELAEAIKGVGIYRNKAKNLVQLGKLLVEEFDSEVPQSIEALETLPGVGHKTASVVVSTAFGVPAFAVDTHVFRVSNRIGLATGKNVVQVEEQLKELIPREEWARAHHWLIHHGRYCCKAQRPLCDTCPVRIRDHCRYRLEAVDEKGDDGAHADHAR